jgi:hypothetical protein
VTIAPAPSIRRGETFSFRMSAASSKPLSAAVAGWIVVPCPSGTRMKPLYASSDCGGPDNRLKIKPRPQPTPTMPFQSRSTTGSSSRPVQKKRWNAMSAGAKPTSMPCLATTKPPAHAAAASVPQVTPMITSCFCTLSSAVMKVRGVTEARSIL